MQPQMPRVSEETVWPPPPRQEALNRPAVPEMTAVWLFGQIVGRAAGMGLTRGALCGAGFGVFFYIIGAVYGVVIGAIAGLLLGVVTGLILGFSTCRYFFPLRQAQKYRRFVGAVSTAVASLPGLLAIIASLQGTDDTTILLVVVFLPSLIAMLAAWTASQRLAEWYEVETLKRR